MGLETSANVWQALAATYAQNSQAREFVLLSKLQLLEKGMSPLSEYLHEFKSICDKLSRIGKAVPDQSKVFWLLSGLGPSYETITTTMLKPLVPSYDDVSPLSQSHDLHNKGHQIFGANPAMVFYGQETNGGHRKGESNFSSKGRGFPQSGQKAPFSLPQNSHTQGS